jgi:tetratricopeptide (TPR) repeat protein
MTTRSIPVYGLFAVSLVACLLAGATARAAQDPLAEAKRAYEAAAYEDALRLLEPLDSIEARQYAALCQLALGRMDAAARTVETMVTAAPLFSPSSADVPPRFATLVTETRRKMLPVAARKAFADGRDRFNAKQMTEAMPHFELAMKIADDPLWRGTSDAQDLRTLAGGFAQLAREATPPASAAAAAAAPPAAPAATPPAARPRPANASSRVTLPMPIKEVIPPLPVALTRTSGPVATMKLQIGANGRVESATVDQSAHPRYDEILVEAAREWVYEPGTLDGKPVPSERILSLRLR